MEPPPSAPQLRGAKGNQSKVPCPWKVREGRHGNIVWVKEGDRGSACGLCIYSEESIAMGNPVLVLL